MEVASTNIVLFQIDISFYPCKVLVISLIQLILNKKKKEEIKLSYENQFLWLMAYQLFLGYLMPKPFS